MKNDEMLTSFLAGNSKIRAISLNIMEIVSCLKPVQKQLVKSFPY